jgi:hypothetical protein
MSDYFGTNLSFDDFDALLTKDDLTTIPVSVDQFVEDSHYLGQPPLSKIQTEIVKYSTQILKLKTLQEMFGEEEGQAYYDKYTKTEIVCQLGKGSGKDHTSRISLAYAAYLLHCLRDPIEYYHKAHGTYIDLVNMAVNAKQAQQVFFDPLKNLLMNSPYFQETAMFEPRVSEIFFFNKPVRMFSGHSEAEGWEGYETLLVVLDEISAFKGLGPNVPVLTPDGWVKNGDLQVGQNVIGQNGNPVRIDGIFPMGKKEVFEITFEDGAKAQCSEDHYWTVNEYSDGRRKSTKTLQLKDFKSTILPTGNKQYRYSIPTVEPVRFSSEDTLDELPVDPYILGILLGDGCITSGAVRFASNDEYIVELVNHRLPTGFHIAHDDGCNYRIVSDDGQTSFSKYLKEIGVWGSSSINKFIPEEYLFASRFDRKMLLAGLMDSDGTPARGQGSYTTVSQNLKDDILMLCRSLGGVPTASKHASWYKDLNDDKVECLDKWMICPRIPFNPFILPRKKKLWKTHRRSLDRVIVDVQKLDFKEEMTCIKVANDDGLYVINDFIVTHNTDSELKGDVRNKGSASQIYNMAKASVTSRFPEWGKVSLLSFPRFKDDFIQQRYNSVINDIINSGETPGPAAEGNSGRDAELMTWALKASTWEVNPTKTEEQFAQEFRRDPIQSRARFMCEPPEMEDAYFRNPVAVRKAFNSLEDPLNEDGTFKEWFVGGKDGHIRFIHTDLGLKRDRASVGVVHCSGLKEIKTLTGVEKLPIINMDFIKSWQANPYEEIPLSEIRELIVQLCRMFDVAMVTFDQWQSADMIQSLRSMNINADLHTVAKRDYDTLSTAIYDERFRGYWNELLVEDELLKLRLINNTKVDHPTKGSKDLADSIAGATYMCMDNLILDTDVDIEIIGGDEEYYDDMGNDDIIISSIMPKKADPIPDDLADWLELI